MRAGARLSAVAVALLLAIGCVTPRLNPPPDLPASVRLVEVDWPPENPAATPRPPRNVLALSGGGVGGAQTRRLSERLDRLGKSARFRCRYGHQHRGAIAPFAFLGPNYDELLERGYTAARVGDVYRLRSIFTLPWADSVADSEPLRKRIESEITPEVLDEIAHAHQVDGRRLYVGTTNLDTKRSVVWDMGAIAASNDKDKLALFRKIILASCSIPGLFPPVAIDIEVNGQRRTELHVDGGVSTSVFLQPFMLGVAPSCEPPTLTGASVYVLVAGKLWPDSHPVERQLLQVTEESLAGVLQTRLEGDLLRIFLLARFTGAGFGLAAVPDDTSEDPDLFSFEPAALQRLFQQGYNFGASGNGWSRVPPGLRPGDHLPPRAGVKFVVAEQVKAAPAIPPAPEVMRRIFGAMGQRSASAPE